MKHKIPERSKRDNLISFSASNKLSVNTGSFNFQNKRRLRAV